MGLFVSSKTFDFGTTEVENLFITDFMMMADGTAIKTYLLGLHYLRNMNGVQDLSNRKLATHMNVSLDDVVRAWQFWEKLGLVQLSESGEDPNEFDITFVPIRQKYLDNNYVTVDKAKIQKATVKRAVSPERLTVFERNEENRRLRQYVEGRVQRELQLKELIGLYEFVEDIGLGYEVVKFGFDYAQQLGKLNRRGSFNYVYRVLEGWKGAGIQTIEEAENHIEMRSAKYRFAYDLERIIGASGSANALTKLIDKWKKKYDYDEIFIKTVAEYLRSTRTKLVPITLDDYFKELHGKNIKTIEEFKTYLSAGEYYYGLMKATGIWVPVELMRSELKKWHEDYGYGKEMIRHILIEQKKRKTRLTLAGAETVLKEAHNLGIKSIEEYNRHLASKPGYGKKESGAGPVKKGNFGKFAQRDKSSLGKLVKSARKADRKGEES
ncbi:DnaD domain protein [Fusibacter sp. JL216-2]|uniref:DnaD domain-containing protein n=1 Tax=Fusibacter sp. JL216-2 TaxID=3071453 RepID=UPI003D3521A7